MRTLSAGAAGLDTWPIQILVYRLAMFHKVFERQQKFLAALAGATLGLWLTGWWLAQSIAGPAQPLAAVAIGALPSVPVVAPTSTVPSGRGSATPSATPRPTNKPMMKPTKVLPRC